MILHTFSLLHCMLRALPRELERLSLFLAKKMSPLTANNWRGAGKICATFSKAKSGAHHIPFTSLGSWGNAWGAPGATITFFEKNPLFPKGFALRKTIFLTSDPMKKSLKQKLIGIKSSNIKSIVIFVKLWVFHFCFNEVLWKNNLFEKYSNRKLYETKTAWN